MCVCILSHTIPYYTILFDTILYYSITMCRAPEDWVGAARRYECQFDAASSYRGNPADRGGHRMRADAWHIELGSCFGVWFKLPY